MSDREEKRRKLEEIVQRGDPEEWLRILQHEATRANNAEATSDYLQHEINVMRRAMQAAGTWDQFCRDYAAYKADRLDQATRDEPRNT